MKFLALGLPEALCRALEQAGITEPTAVQTGAIPIALEGRDLISSARTGSGKTLAYCLPTLVRLSQNKRAAALVLVPTREIGVQVQTVLQPYLRAMQLAPATLIIGGVSMGPQVANLRRNPAVIIATPGRLNDHLRSAKLRLDHVTTLVLDEADRMLDMGFLPQVRQILQHLSKERQTLLFSATMPPDLKQACHAMLRDPAQVAVDAPNTANVDIEQKMIEVTSDGKQDALLDVVKDQTESVLIFARTKRRTDRVAQFLEKYGVKAERIHGDRSQSQRQKAIDSFRSGKTKVLVATDIAARGLDIPLVELVINFDLPEAREDYVHRIGRTGRAGEKGVALSFVAPEDRGHWASISGQKREGGAAPRAQYGSNGGRSRPQQPSRSFGGRPQRDQERREPRVESDRRDQRSFEPRGERPASKPSRFKSWGAPRRDERDAAPARREAPAYDGRQRENHGVQNRTPRTGEGPRFGGHGRGAPAMAGSGRPRGRWSKQPNREQPTGGPTPNF
ncbi:MAG: DEAD/DEAH box helicase [Bdellovibrionota bacterium]